jgi:hypothetical protein
MKRNLLIILFALGINFLGISQVIDTSFNSIPVDPIYFLDEVRISSEDIQKVNPNDLAAIEVLKDSSAISVLGEEGKNGVIYITTINYAREKYIQYLSSKSADFERIVHSLGDEDIVTYILNNKILEKKNAGDLYFINDENYIALRVINKAELEKQYNISDKEYGIIILTKQKDKK